MNGFKIGNINPQTNKKEWDDKNELIQYTEIKDVGLIIKYSLFWIKVNIERAKRSSTNII